MPNEITNNYSFETDFTIQTGVYRSVIGEEGQNQKRCEAILEVEEIQEEVEVDAV
jgi:hypothetical protein